MTLYEFKMYVKRLRIVKYFLKKRTEKEEESNKIALRDNGLNLIIDVENILNETGILYFADYGTLLGIIRDNNFISWDDDIDYGLIINDTFNWIKFELLLNHHGFFKTREFKYKDEVREQAYSNGYMSIDFFGYKNNKINTIGYGFYRREDFIYKSSKEFHVREYINPKIIKTKKVDFLGTKVSVPYNAEDYLESVYTEHWRIPDPDWVTEDNDKGNILELNEIGFGTFYNNI